jgi:D-glycerate 3-kinase
MIDPAAINNVLQRILPAFQSHKLSNTDGVFVLGLSGLQGSGKSTWAKALCETLNETLGIHTRTLSLDDLYHCRQNLVRLREENPGNQLLRNRGQPGTHDEVLAAIFFASLHQTPDKQEPRKAIRLPAFDKSLFNGEGDRVGEESWKEIPPSPALEMLIFEGWCVGFRPLSRHQLETKWKASRAVASQDRQDGASVSTLARHDLENLLAINENLARYCSVFMGPDHFDALVHLTTDDLANVYQWRLGQEKASREARGSGMTDAEAVRFIDVYMPSYELYLDSLNRDLFFPPSSGKPHVRVVLDPDRIVREIKDC